ncbi:MAG TPA: CDP-alcohol phosphatidyltransferase family protein [Vicinamibacterales bacterium]
MSEVRTVDAARPSWVVLLPNAITGCRLLAAPVLLGAALERWPRLFAWLLLACLASDIADGLLARTLRVQSPSGAALDSAADILVTVIGGIGTVTMQWPFIVAQALRLELLAGLFVGEVLVSLARYHRLSSFHTYLVRASAYVQGAFLLSLFFWGYSAPLFHAMWIISCLGQLEEWALLAILPEWRCDVRGLYWVLKARRR